MLRHTIPSVLLGICLFLALQLEMKRVRNQDRIREKDDE